MAPERVTYWDYIRVEDLLSLQQGLGDGGDVSNDEVTFITVHQIFELWFKLVQGEMRSARDLFTREHVLEQELSGAVRSLGRIGTILRMAASHFEVMETLTTRDYLAFRDKLMGASGFQSAQLRQIEILFGLEEADRISLGGEGGYLEALRAPGGGGSPALDRVRASLADTPSLREAIDAWLYRTPIDGTGPDDREAERHLDGFVGRYIDAHGRATDETCAKALAVADPAVDRAAFERRYLEEKNYAREFLQAGDDEKSRRRRRVRCAMIFIETYRELPLLAWPREVLDRLVEVEQLFVIFRQRHARMVERVIGRRVGTGGSSGVDYLDTTALKYRVFRDLWTVRTLQIAREAAPALDRADFYGFRADT
jgi:tryptophan 2,3-dioxygenase